jgi:CRP-like cAMP-binding protein
MLGMPWLSWQALRRTQKNYIEDSRIHAGVDLDSTSLMSAAADAKPTAIHHWESSIGLRSQLEMTPGRILPQGNPIRRFSMSVRSKPKSGLVCVASSQLFAGFSDRECVNIASRARERSFNRDELLFSQGDRVENLVLLRSGTVKHTQVSSGGNEVILRISCGGDVLTFQGLSSAPEHSCTVRATEICEALVWDYREIERLFTTYPKLRTNVDHILINELVEMEKRFREMATERAPSRLALSLLRLHKQIGKNRKHGVVLSFSREELAQMAGTTVFTVSRLLSRWSELGLVNACREEVIVNDDERLLRFFAEGGQRPLLSVGPRWRRGQW